MEFRGLDDAIRQEKTILELLGSPHDGRSDGSLYGQYFFPDFFRVLFKTPVFFAEELSRYAFLWMVFLGLSYATLHDKHIRVTLLVEKFPFTLQRITEILIHLLAIACFCWIGVTSISWLKFISGSVTNAMRIPRWILGLILPLSAVLVVIRSIQKIVACCRTIAAHRKEDEFE